MPGALTVTFLIPPPLRERCGGAAKVPVPASNVREALRHLEQAHPDLHRGICDETGKVRTHINLFVNTTHIRAREGLDTVLRPGDEIWILPAVSGG